MIAVNILTVIGFAISHCHKLFMLFSSCSWYRTGQEEARDGTLISPEVEERCSEPP
jgi:hypothetical protein